MWLEGGAGRGWVSSEKILIGWQDGVEHGWKEEGEEASGYEGTPVSSGGVSGTQSSKHTSVSNPCKNLVSNDLRVRFCELPPRTKTEEKTRIKSRAVGWERAKRVGDDSKQFTKKSGGRGQIW